MATHERRGRISRGRRRHGGYNGLFPVAEERNRRESLIKQFTCSMLVFEGLTNWHWWREDLQSRLVRGIGPSSPTGTDNERQKGDPLVPGEGTETKGGPLVSVRNTNLD
jgi:hypothetical protein